MWVKIKYYRDYVAQYVRDELERQWTIDYRPKDFTTNTSLVGLALNNRAYIRVYCLDEQLSSYDHGRTVYGHVISGTVECFVPAYVAHEKYIDMENEIGRILDNIRIPETINLIRGNASRRDDEKVLRGIIHFEVWAVG